MADILHRIGIKPASIDDVYQALTIREKLAGWWTSHTKGEGDRVGSLLEFHFQDVVFKMEVIDLAPSKKVVWQVVNGPEEWVGTRISWELQQEDDYTIVLFKHLDWKNPGEFMHHCSTKWATFLISLKSLIETGKGAPHPDDLKIDNWN